MTNEALFFFLLVMMPLALVAPAALYGFPRRRVRRHGGDVLADVLLFVGPIVIAILFALMAR